MPWSLLHRPLQHLDPFFGGFFDDLWNVGRGPLEAHRHPEAPLNAWLGENDAVVTVELPGVRPEAIELSVEGNVLEVASERPPAELGKGERFHRRERFSGRMERRLKLPFRVDAKAVEARYENGVLEVTLPRAEEDRPRRVEVKVG